MVKKIKKRNGQIVRFKLERIEEAILKCLSATEDDGREKARDLAKKTQVLLESRFGEEEVPHVEDIQDTVEETLMREGLFRAARAYILYRDQRRRVRKVEGWEQETVNKADQYIRELDWEVKENANMTYSLQGLNNYLASHFIKKYWLEKVYPPEIRKGVEEGDFHIHDLQTLGSYCTGWDLYDLLKRGFGGVKGKIHSKPPKHLKTALGQIVNFLYTVQGECYSEDTQVLTANGWKYFYEVSPKDEVFTLNNQTDEIELQQPTRFYRYNFDGELYNFRSQKLDLLVTPEHNMVVDQYCPGCKENYARKIVKAKNFNPNTNFIPKQGIWKGKEKKWFVLPGIRVFQCRNFQSLENWLGSFTGSPSQDLLEKARNGEKGKIHSFSGTTVETSQPIWKYAVKEREDKRVLMDDWLRFFGFYIAEGSVSLREREREGRENPYYEYSVRIGHNNDKTLREFEEVVERLPFHFRKKSYKEGKKIEIEITDKQLFSYLKQFGTAGEKFLPKEIKNLSRRQLRILFDWMMKGDGYIGNGNVEYYTKSKKLADDVQEIVLKLGWSANIYEKHKGDFTWYKVGVSRAKRFKLSNKERNVKKVKYKGPVFCLEVPNHTLYVRRNNKACWCGNCAGAVALSNFDTLLAPFVRRDQLSYPQVKQAMQGFLFNMNVATRVGFQTPFTNLTLDISPSPVFEEQPVIIGGEPRDEEYGGFQPEMDMINRAFYELMMEGDAQDRVFSVDSECLCPIKNSSKLKMVKIGDYIDELMKEEPPVLLRQNKAEVLDVRKKNIKCLGLKEEEIRWQKVNFLVRHPADSLLKISTVAGRTIKVTPSHSVLVLRGGRIQDFPASRLKEGDYLVSPRKTPSEQAPDSSLSLAHNFVKEEKADGIYIRDVLKDDKPYKEKRTRTHKRDYGKREYNCSYGVSVFPLGNIGSELEEFDLSRAKLSLRGSRIKIKNELLIDENLVEFLGWYCAEGSAERSEKYGGISFGLNLEKEKKRAQRICSLSKKIFGEDLPVKLREIEKRNLIEVRIHSKLVRRVITEVFGIRNRKEKRVPRFVFEASTGLKKTFLSSYFKGDAWTTEDVVVNSTSRELIYGVSFLLTQLEVFHTLNEYSSEGRKRYRLHIFNNLELEPKRSRTVAKIPLEESGTEALIGEILEKEPYFENSLGRKYENTKKRVLAQFGISPCVSTSLNNVKKIMEHARSLNIDIPPALKQVEKDDLLFLKVKDVEKTSTSNGMVYDFSTESENFVADQLLVHNTFPIPTVNITPDFPWQKEALEPMWEATAKYGINYFGNYVNSSMKPEDIRSMCPLHGDEKVLIRSSRGRGLEYVTIRGAAESRSGRDYEIYSDGRFIKGTFNRFRNQKMLRVVLENGHKIRMSDKHLNFVSGGPDSDVRELAGEDLEKGMYLPYSLNAYEGEGGNADLGYFVGAYAGDGSFDKQTGVVFSLENKRKKHVVKKLKRIARDYFGASCSEKPHPETDLHTLRVNSKAVVGLCRDFVKGKGRKKHYRAKLFGMSQEFRKGVIEGHYDTDGGNRHRIYTSSPKMVETLNMLAASLGTATSIYEDGRDRRLGKAPNFAVLIYQLNRDNYGDFWFKKDGKLWVKIKEIKKEKRRTTAYCFEVKNGEPVFTIGTTGVLTHNCRLRLEKDKLYNRGGGGLFGSGSLTGSIGVVTVNMPRIGYLSQDKKEFLDRLEGVMDLAKESLEIKRKTVEHFTERGLYPYCKHWLGSIKKMRGEYWGNHFSTIGLVGMNEALLNFMDRDMGSRRGQRFAKKVLEFMRERLVKYQEETGNLYNLEATPGEGTAFRLPLKDKKEYPDIITAGTEEDPYYTNSTHLPVDYTDDVFRALKLQDDLQCLYTGGTVSHLFLGERINDPDQAKRLVKKVFKESNLPYITLTPTFSVCPTHGYISGEHFTCPRCTIEQPCEVYSRIVGYLRPVSQWNEGKRQEYTERQEYKSES